MCIESLIWSRLMSLSHRFCLEAYGSENRESILYYIAIIYNYYTILTSALKVSTVKSVCSVVLSLLAVSIAARLSHTVLVTPVLFS